MSVSANSNFPSPVPKDGQEPKLNIKTINSTTYQPQNHASLPLLEHHNDDLSANNCSPPPPISTITSWKENSVPQRHLNKNHLKDLASVSADKYFPPLHSKPKPITFLEWTHKVHLQSPTIPPKYLTEISPSPKKKEFEEKPVNLPQSDPQPIRWPPLSSKENKYFRTTTATLLQKSRK